MQKITPTDPLAKSPELAAENIAKLRTLFPELVTESADGIAINTDVLKQLVGDATVTDADEKYGLNWHGKRRARQLALTPSTGTLRPAPEDSVDWDTTQNIMIEGDNLEVLKLLQKSYAGKVKLIYIDPPYNTGKDFVYPDNFQDNIKNYLELTGQTGEDGKKLATNTESSGRFHTDWLNMMYPRLTLAKSLLAPDGLMFISINDKEFHSLRFICDDIFGEENFVETYIWNSTFRPDNSSAIYRKNAEYLVCFARQLKLVTELVGEVIDRTGLPSLTKSSMPKSTLTFPKESVQFAIPDGQYGRGPKDTYELLDDVVVEHGTNATEFRLFGPVIWNQANLINELRQGTKIHIKTAGFVPYVDKGDSGKLRPAKIIPKELVGDVLAANSDLAALFDHDVFPYPKPVSLLGYLVQLRQNHDLILDMFAGSGTMAQAVLEHNLTRQNQARFITIQVPEPLDPSEAAHQGAIEFCRSENKKPVLSEVTKARIRRAGAKIKADNPLFAGDLGFRVFKLDSTNIREWDANRDNFPATLEDSIEHLKQNRSELDILFELLLKLGLDLCVPIETKSLTGSGSLTHEIHSIGAGTLMVCLSSSIPQADVETLAMALVTWHKALAPAGDTTAVFRDAAFADDVAKTNLTAILNQHGIETVRSL